MALENEDMSRLKEVFVTKENCNKNIELQGNKFDEITNNIFALREEMRVERAKTNDKLNVVTAILTMIGGAVVPLCVKLLFGG